VPTPPVRPVAVAGLAAARDLAALFVIDAGSGAVGELLGRSAVEQPARYARRDLGSQFRWPGQRNLVLRLESRVTESSPGASIALNVSVQPGEQAVAGAIVIKKVE
jgi:hypothetical protein